MSKTNGKRNGKAETDLAKLAAARNPRNEKGQLMPGSSLNPEGARRGHAAKWRARLNELLEGPVSGDEEQTQMDSLLWVAIEAARGGDAQFMKLVWDRVMPATSHHTVEDVGLTPGGVGGVIGLLRAEYVRTGVLGLPDS